MDHLGKEEWILVTVIASHKKESSGGSLREVGGNCSCLTPREWEWVGIGGSTGKKITIF